MKEHLMPENGFEQYIRNVASLAIPREVEENFRNRLIAFREKMESADFGQNASPLFSLRRALRVRKTRYILASGFIAALLLLGVFLKPWDRTPKSAYGEVVDMIKNARSVTFKAIGRVEGMPEMAADYYYKRPNLMRMSTSNEKVDISSIFDLDKKRGIVINHTQKKYIPIDLTSIPDNIGQKNMIDYFESLRSLPSTADSMLGIRTIDGRQAEGYLTEEKGMRRIVWIETLTDDLVRIDMESPNLKGVHQTWRDFSFNIILEDSMFNMTPPEEYSIDQDAVVPVPKGTPGENDFTAFLKFYASAHKEDLFCPSVNDMGQMMSYLKEMDKAKLMKLGKPDKEVMSSMQNGMKFFMLMKPENDWHYAGKGIKLGSADIPIAWWKPDSSTTYRVIYGDLQIRDVRPEELNKPEFNRK